jgi:hypothetical protein
MMIRCCYKCYRPLQRIHPDEPVCECAYPSIVEITCTVTGMAFMEAMRTMVAPSRQEVPQAFYRAFEEEL